eukprot:CAMPEP_0178410760 /NCGR_PEP_ID=MMETSP0689_2-20121128/21150_1 /TAXON_ID=160604 /ORGANISM="Amphidinium massartii, Strain CS-259" /LENGTH=356 /DNA_ID=CAMNT_0020031955 /DNA_START=92 /DNA_END=1162 /DNA_ORIENTATION=-
MKLTLRLWYKMCLFAIGSCLVLMFLSGSGCCGCIPRGSQLAEEEVYRVGVVTDVQYADREDGMDYSGLFVRHYRKSLEFLRHTVAQWKMQGVMTVIDLGDGVDGSNLGKPTAQQLVLSELTAPNWNLVRVLGNHEYYNGFVKKASRSYRRLELCDGWRLLLLDGFDVSVFSTDKKKSRRAQEYLTANNPNLWHGNFTPGAAVWLRGLEGREQRWTPLNGALSSDQLQWLKRELQALEDDDVWAVVASHIPILPDVTHAEGLLWNYDEALAVLATSSRVGLVLAGHSHRLRMGVQSGNQVPHLTLPAPLEQDPNFYSECGLTLELPIRKPHAAVSSGRFIRLLGQGPVLNVTLPLNG